MGMSQADFYQMFAYGHKYCGGKGEMMLIYPRTELLKELVQQSFDFSENLKLWVVPFDVNSNVDDNKRLFWPEGFAEIYEP